MVWIVYEIFILLLAFFMWRYKGKIYNPGTLFLGFWFVLILLTKMRLFELKEISNTILDIVFLGCIFYFIGALLKSKRIFIRRFIRNDVSEARIPLNGSVFKILLILCITSLLYRFSFQIQYLLAGYTITDIRYGNLVEYTGISVIVFNYFALPFLDAAITVLITNNVLSDKGLKSYILPLLLLILSMMSNGARLAIYQIIVVLFFALVINKKISLAYLKRFLPVFAVAIGLVLFINNNRSSSNSIFEGMYTYFCGGLVFGEHVLSSTSFFKEYLYGINSFGGVARPVFSILGVFGINEPIALAKAGAFMSQSMQNTVWPVSDNGAVFNYFCTCFVYFFKDGGYIAVVLISFIYGKICNYFYERMNKKLSVRSCALYLYIISGIFISVMHFCFSSFLYVMSLVYIYILTMRTQKSVINKDDS